MLKSAQTRADAQFWTPEMRDTALRKRLEGIDMPEEIFRAIEGRRTKRAMEMKTRLLEIEQTL
jgi:hypothetical protein